MSADPSRDDTEFRTGAGLGHAPTLFRDVVALLELLGLEVAEIGVTAERRDPEKVIEYLAAIEEIAVQLHYTFTPPFDLIK